MQICASVVPALWLVISALGLVEARSSSEAFRKREVQWGTSAVYASLFRADLAHGRSDIAFAALRGKEQAGTTSDNVFLGLQRQYASIVLLFDTVKEKAALCWSALVVAAVFFGLWCILLIWLGHCRAPASRDSRDLQNSQDTSEHARSLLLLFQYQDSFLYTVVILDSYRLARAMGVGAVWSGWFIGGHALGVAIGCSVLWLIIGWFPDLWRRPHKTLGVGACLIMLGAGGLSAGIFHASEPSLDWASSPGLPALMMTARVFIGVGCGLHQFMLRQIFAYITPPADRPNQVQRAAMVNNLGMGSGPFTAALAWAVQDVWPCSLSGTGLDVLGAIIPTSTLVVLLAVMYLPSLESVKDEIAAAMPLTARESQPLTASDSQMSFSNEEVRRRCIVVMCAVVFAGGRSFAVSSIDAATAMLLEVEYRWDPRAIGLAISFCFFSSYFVKQLHDAYKDTITLSSRLRLLMAGSFLGAIMMIPSLCFFSYAKCAFMLLAADSILFPCFNLSDATMQGMMYNHVLQGSIMNINNMTILVIFVGVAVGKFLGPPTARWTVERGGQWDYALWQIAICITAILLAEFAFFFKAAEDPEKTSQKSIQEDKQEEDPKSQDLQRPKDPPKHL